MTTDIGNGLVHVRIGMDLPTPCGIEFTGPWQTLTTGSSLDTVTCPICRSALIAARLVRSTKTF